jgi:hypothetical protein
LNKKLLSDDRYFFHFYSWKHIHRYWFIFLEAIKNGIKPNLSAAPVTNRMFSAV